MNLDFSKRFRGTAPETAYLTWPFVRSDILTDGIEEWIFAVKIVSDNLTARELAIRNDYDNCSRRPSPYLRNAGIISLLMLASSNRAALASTQIASRLS